MNIVCIGLSPLVQMDVQEAIGAVMGECLVLSMSDIADAGHAAAVALAIIDPSNLPSDLDDTMGVFQGQDIAVIALTETEGVAALPFARVARLPKPFSSEMLVAALLQVGLMNRGASRN